MHFVQIDAFCTDRCRRIDGLVAGTTKFYLHNVGDWCLAAWIIVAP